VNVPIGVTESVEAFTKPPAPPPPPPRFPEIVVDPAPPPPPPPPTTRYCTEVTPAGMFQVHELAVVNFAKRVVPETVPYVTVHAAAFAVGAIEGRNVKNERPRTTASAVRNALIMSQY
jgi:hypothetical protein